MTEDRDAYTDDVLARIHVAQQDNVDEAYRAAAARGKWAGRLPSERAAVLRRAAAIWKGRREEIIDWLIRVLNVVWVGPCLLTAGKALFRNSALNFALWYRTGPKHEKSLAGSYLPARPCDVGARGFEPPTS